MKKFLSVFLLAIMCGVVYAKGSASLGYQEMTNGSNGNGSGGELRLYKWDMGYADDNNAAVTRRYNMEGPFRHCLVDRLDMNYGIITDGAGSYEVGDEWPASQVCGRFGCNENDVRARSNCRVYRGEDGAWIADTYNQAGHSIDQTGRCWVYCEHE